jgi:tyrosyl-tRNA synthetase
VAESVKRVSKVLFGGEPYSKLEAADFEVLKAELPTVQAKKSADLLDILVEGRLASSKGEARRFLSNKAIYINGDQISLGKSKLETSDAIAGHAVLRRGKNAQIIVVI